MAMNMLLHTTRGIIRCGFGYPVTGMRIEAITLEADDFKDWPALLEYLQSCVEVRIVLPDAPAATSNSVRCRIRRRCTKALWGLLIGLDGLLQRHDNELKTVHRDARKDTLRPEEARQKTSRQDKPRRRTERRRG